MPLRLILLSPFVLLLVLFAVSNTTVVPIGLWPTGLTIDAPVAVAILVGMAAAFLLGAAFVWFGSLSHRRRARRAEAQVAALQAELALTRTRAPTAPAVVSLSR
jgi:uncharacterized integral membrane protein